MDASGKPLPKNAHEEYVYLSPFKSITSSASTGSSINPDVLPTRTNNFGKSVTSLEGDGTSPETLKDLNRVKTLPTDQSGRVIYPIVVDEDGALRPTDIHGRYVDAGGKQIPIDKSGRPLGHLGEILPVNNNGQFVYVDAKTESGVTLPTDETGKLVLAIVDANGVLLPTEASGRHIGGEFFLICQMEQKRNTANISKTY